MTRDDSCHRLLPRDLAKPDHLMHNSWFLSPNTLQLEKRLKNIFFMKKLPVAVRWKCRARVSGSLFCTVSTNCGSSWQKIARLCVISCPTFPLSPTPWWLLRQKPVFYQPFTFKLTRIQHLSPRIFTDMSDTSHAVATGTLRRGVTRVLLTKCVNSLPRKQSSLFNVFLFRDIRGCEDLRQLEEKLTLHLSCRGFRLLRCVFFFALWCVTAYVILCGIECWKRKTASASSMRNTVWKSYFQVQRHGN